MSLRKGPVVPKPARATMVSEQELPHPPAAAVAGSEEDAQIDYLEDQKAVDAKEAPVLKEPPPPAENLARAIPPAGAITNRPPAGAATNLPTAVAATEGLSAMIEELMQEGVNPEDLGFGAFPIITLQPEGEFQSSEGPSLGQEFECTILNVRDKWVYKNGLKDEEEDLAYSYDGVRSTNGQDLADVMNAWKAAGCKVEIKPYKEIMVVIRGGKYDNEIALLSIPPTSKAKYAGYALTLKMKGLDKTKVITRCARGMKVTKAVKPFFPWDFKLAQ